MYIDWNHGAVETLGTGTYTPAGANLTKASGTSSWDNEARAAGQEVRAPLRIKWKCADENDVVFVGISTAIGASQDWQDIPFSIYHWGGNKYDIYESGSLVSADVTGAAPQAGDLLEIRVDADGVVTYYVNGTLEYTSAATADTSGLYAFNALLWAVGDGIVDCQIFDDLSVTTGAEATITIEMKTGASTWTTIPDVIANHGIRLHYGLPGAGLRDRVAGTGRMEFVVNNGAGNNAGLEGYYAPGHANQWGGGGSYPFDLGAEVRLKIVYGATTYYKFRGYIDDLEVIPGRYAEKGRRTHVTVVDWMDQAARASVSGLAVQLAQRSDELFETILDAMETQPPASQVGYGQDTYPYALDNTRDESVSVMTEFQRLAMSEFGFIFVKGDNVQGGTLVFENRLKRGQKTSAVASLDDLILIDMPTSYQRDDVLNNIQVQIYPRRIDAAANTVLFTLQNTPEIKAGTTLSLKGTYRDPAGGSKTRVGGTSMVTPVANTDYTANTQSDGGGTDLTADFSVSATYAGNSVEYEITNSGAVDGYLTLLQARGKGLYSFESVLFEKADATSQAAYGDNIARVSLPYQSESLIGEEVAYYVLSQNKNPATRVLGATFVAQDSDTNMTNAITREISDRIAISEPMTAVDAEYFINAIEWNISPGGLIRCSWLLAPASLQEYWILETDGYTELDETTVLAYGLFAPQWQLDVSNLGVDTTVNAV